MKWLVANEYRVEEYDMELDEFSGDGGHDWSIWVYLKPGWINEELEAHLIHEFYVKDFMIHAAAVQPCECDDCKYELNKIAEKQEGK